MGIILITFCDEPVSFPQLTPHRKSHAIMVLEPGYGEFTQADGVA